MNIHKTKFICKASIFNNIALLVITTFLLGNNGMCFSRLTDASLKDKRFGLSSLPRSKDQQAAFEDRMLRLKDHARYPLGVVSYLKRDHQIALIEIDAPGRFGQAESKKMGLLFYATRPLKDCIGIHLSDEEVGLSYFDGSSELLVNSYIEVEGQWLDGLFEEEQVEPLFDQDGRSRLQANCITDFKLLKLSNYGIASCYDTNGLVFLEASQDKKRFEELNHAGFMVTKDIPPSTSELAQLVRHLSTNTIQDTDMICPASVSGHTLQPKNPLGHAVYCYVSHGRRYRLIPLKNNPCAGYRSYYGGIDKGVVQQAGFSPVPQAAVVGGDSAEKDKETVDLGINPNLDQPGENGYDNDQYFWDNYDSSSCSLEESDHYYNDGFIDDDWNNISDVNQSQYNNSNISNIYSLYSSPYLTNLQDDDDTADRECDTSSIGSSIFESNFNEDSGYGQNCIDEQKKGHSSLDDSGIDSDGMEDNGIEVKTTDYQSKEVCDNPDISDSCNKDAKNYYQLAY